MGHTFTSLLVHVVFATKERSPVLTSQMLPKVHGYLHGIAIKLETKPFAIGGVADHVHLFAAMPPKLSVTEFVGKLKANSSRWINESHSIGRFAWQEGYSAFAVSPSKRDTVIKYIRNQEKHHRKVTFAEELAWFLKNHGIVP